MTTTTAGHSPRSIAAWLTALLMFLTLAACGGSGAGAGGGGDLGGSQAQSLTLAASSDELKSDGFSTVTLTATVKDGGNRALANQQVVFSTTDPSLTLIVDNERTDSTGQANAQVVTSDPHDRTVEILATVQGGGGTILARRPLAVVGASVVVNGPGAIAFGSPSTFTVAVRDSASQPVAGTPVTLASAAGNTIAVPTATTDAAGRASFTVTGAVNGADTLVATALGKTSAGYSVTVSGVEFGFLQPGADGAELPMNAAQAVRVRLLENGAPAASQQVTITTTRGTVTPSTVTTDANGEATATITSADAGFATITGTGPGGTTASRSVEFVATVPAKLALQASPNVVGVNLGTGGTNSSQLLAMVRDAADTPVKNQRVDFSALTDLSNGRVEPAYAITDSNGQATASFIPGANSTGPDGVVVQAAVHGTSITPATTTLTVAHREVSITIETGNEIAEPDSTTYMMPWNATVSDSSGAPIAGAAVIVQLEPLGFRTGRWITGGGGGSGWSQQINATCKSEDINRNGLLDAGEDNLSVDVGTVGALDPRVSAATAQVVSPGKLTDANGQAKIEVRYAQGFAAWTRVRLRASISAPGGTEVVSSKDFWLPVLAADIQNTDITPPGADSPRSPYGEGIGCPAL